MLKHYGNSFRQPIDEAQRMKNKKLYPLGLIYRLVDLGLPTYSSYYIAQVMRCKLSRRRDRNAFPNFDAFENFQPVAQVGGAHDVTNRRIEICAQTHPHLVA